MSHLIAVALPAAESSQPNLQIPLGTSYLLCVCDSVYFDLKATSYPTGSVSEAKCLMVQNCSLSFCLFWCFKKNIYIHVLFIYFEVLRSVLVNIEINTSINSLHKVFCFKTISLSQPQRETSTLNNLKKPHLEMFWVSVRRQQNCGTSRWSCMQAMLASVRDNMLANLYEITGSLFKSVFSLQHTSRTQRLFIL